MLVLVLCLVVFICQDDYSKCYASIRDIRPIRIHIMVQFVSRIFHSCPLAPVRSVDVRYMVPPHFPVKVQTQSATATSLVTYRYCCSCTVVRPNHFRCSEAGTQTPTRCTWPSVHPVACEWR